MAPTPELNAEIAAARSKWQYRGQQRPGFAEATTGDQQSVWDFPRPPRIEAVSSRLSVTDPGTSRCVAETLRGLRVCETAGAPTYYFPADAVDLQFMVREGHSSVCEWKGRAVGYAVFGEPAQAWCYESVFPEFARIRGWFGFYPTRLACFIDSQRVTPQPGGFYGGWVSVGLRGPIKGEPGSEAW
jgi:uncharacterized protein (DUF427 family)